MKWLVPLLLLAPASAFAACPPMSAYSVNGVSADAQPLSEAVAMLFAGTAWKPDITGPASSVRVTFRGVSGPLDQVFAKVIDQAGRASDAPVSAVSDPTRCVATVAIRPLAPAPTLPAGAAATGSPMGASVSGFPVPPTSPVAVAPIPDVRPDVLRAGMNLSDALKGYVEKRGWKMRWLIDQDYVLDVDLPVPSMNLIDGVTWVVRAYQAQGGMEGVVPRFAKGNSVVVIEKMDVRENNQ